MDLYHVLNRGVEKRTVVLDDKDRLRFLHDLYAFNDQNATLNYILPKRQEERVRKLLVHIHAFCLMKNHYHLILSPLVEDGIPLFMKKLSMGYAKYFNEKYERSGSLWQGRYKRVLVERDAHFLYLPYYVHLNPLDFSFPEWREGKVKNVGKTLAYLAQYRWSSHPDYLGIRNFPSITNRELLSKTLGSRSVYEREISHIISNPELAHESERFE